LTPEGLAAFGPSGEDSPGAPNPEVFAEFWISLASLLSTYTAAHGLGRNVKATVDLDEDKITVRHGKKCLDLKRDGAIITWTRENGNIGTLQLTEHGSLRGPAGEQALDMAVEAWAQDLMQDE
jgi:hypothetical protein